MKPLEAHVVSRYFFSGQQESGHLRFERTLLVTPGRQGMRTCAVLSVDEFIMTCIQVIYLRRSSEILYTCPSGTSSGFSIIIEL